MKFNKLIYLMFICLFLIGYTKSSGKESKNGGKYVTSVGHFIIAPDNPDIDDVFGKELVRSSEQENQGLMTLATDENGKAKVGTLEKGTYLLIMDRARLRAASEIRQNYSEDELPAGAAFDAETGEFSWKPSYNDEGAFEVTLLQESGELRFRYGSALYSIILPRVRGVEFVIAKKESFGRSLPIIKIVVSQDMELPPMTFICVNDFGVGEKGRIIHPDSETVKTFLIGK